LRIHKIGGALLIGAFLWLGACSSNRAPATEPSGGAAAATTVFGDEMSLTGYTIGNKDGHTQVELRWKAVRKPAADYNVFVHALDGSGAVAFQGDHPLKNAAGAATGDWKTGDSVEDRFLMSSPANRAPGVYTLRIGVWDLKTGKVLNVPQTNLPQPDDGWKGRVVLIEKVECK